MDNTYFLVTYDTMAQRDLAFTMLENAGYSFLDDDNNKMSLWNFSDWYSRVYGASSHRIFFVSIPLKRLCLTSVYRDGKRFSIGEPKGTQKLSRYLKKIEKEYVCVKNVGSDKYTALVTPKTVQLGSYNITYGEIHQISLAVKESRASKTPKRVPIMGDITQYGYGGTAFTKSFRVGCQKITYEKWDEVLEAIKRVAPKMYEAYQLNPNT